jgi:hypothetical protein
MISESTWRASSAMPWSATWCRRRSSKLNGRVTTATVRMPSSFATCAITGAAPVPVPPPMPAVMNSMSAPSRCSARRSLSSSAARAPTSGFEPAPRPRVTDAPRRISFDAFERSSACASVLATMNSTPSMLAASMCSMALPPPPPTPITLITAPCSLFTSSNGMFPCSKSESCPARPVPRPCAPRRLPVPRRASRMTCSSLRTRPGTSRGYGPVRRASS